MYTRSLKPPERSFFLFGPRGTGKSTWVKSHFPKALYFDLLKSNVFLRFQQDPSLFHKEVAILAKGSWVVIDEIQKLPILLDEVHSLIEETSIKFVLTGSSARKLKRQGANLLAGRASNRFFFPLTQEELQDDFVLEDVLKYGSLPAVIREKSPQGKVDFLESYAATYLKEEIQQEAVVKNLSSFARFLSIAALFNGQKVNLSSLSRDAGVARPTAQGYFQVLTDTLIGSLLPAWTIKLRVKEVDHPKFYFFDPGVVRALLNQLRDPLDSVEKGTLFETYILHELKAHISSRSLGGEFYYWGTHNGVEADFIWVRGKRAIGFEVKSSKRWRSEYSDALKILLDSGKVQKAYGIYLGSESMISDEVEVYPLSKFLELLSKNKVFESSP